MDLDTKILNMIKDTPMTASEIFKTIREDVDIHKARVAVRLSYLRKWNLVVYEKIGSTKQGRNPLQYSLSAKGKSIL